MKSKKFWNRVGLGFIICLPVALIVAGPSVLVFFVISILCTFGIASIAYIFLFYVIGAIAAAIYEGISESRNEQKIPGKKSTNNLTHVQEAALGYITTARRRGIPDKSIVRTMKENGWSEDTIHSFFPEP